MTDWKRAMPAALGGYQIDLLFQGYPGKSAHNGGLGWSSVVLLRGFGRIALLDTGGFGLRAALRQKLASLNVEPGDVTDILISHCHWDHIANYPLFPNARLHAGKVDLDWANSGDGSVYAVAEFYARELASDPKLELIDLSREVLPGITAELAPGHTPGHLLFVLQGEDRDIIFVQDAAKSRAELVSMTTDLTVDLQASRATIERIWTLWRQRDGSIVLPGHDLPMILEAAAIRMLGERKAGIIGLLGDTLEDVTHFSLSERAADGFAD